MDLRDWFCLFLGLTKMKYTDTNPRVGPDTSVEVYTGRVVKWYMQEGERRDWL